MDNEYAFLYNRYDGMDQIVEGGHYSSQKNIYEFGFYILHHDETEWEFYDFENHRLYTKTTAHISQDSFISRVPNEYEYAGADTAALFFTTNRGLEWEKRNPYDGNLTISHVLQPHYVKGRVFTTARADGHVHLYHSDDFGLTWHKNPLNAMIDSGQSASIYGVTPHFILVQASPTSFYRSTDLGNTWAPVSGYAKPAMASIQQPHTLVGNRAVVSFYGMVADTLRYIMFASLDSGRTWTIQQTEAREDIYWIAERHTKQGYIAFINKDGKFVYRYLDTSFKEVGIPAFKGLEHRYSWLLHVSEDSLFSMNGPGKPGFPIMDTIYRCRENIETWSPYAIPNGYEILSGSWRAGEKYLYTVAKLSSAEVLVRSSDNGRIWEVAMPDSVPTFIRTQILAHTNDTIRIFTYGGMFTSLNGGDDWSDSINTFAGVFHRGYLYSTPDTGDEINVIRSLDLGRTWETVSTLPKNDSTYVYTLSHSVDTVLFISRTGFIQDSNNYSLTFALFRSTDLGFSWIDVSNQFAHTTEDPRIRTNDGRMYLLMPVALNPSKNSDRQLHLYVSDDGGLSWKHVEANIPQADDILFSRFKIYLSSPQGGIYSMDKTLASVPQQRERQYSTVRFVPNPVRNKTEIHFITKDAGMCKVTFADMAGKIVYTAFFTLFDPGSQVVAVDLSTLEEGVYIINIHTDKGTIAGQCVIVR